MATLGVDDVHFVGAIDDKVFVVCDVGWIASDLCFLVGHLVLQLTVILTVILFRF
jgi:hypothetical protein